MVPAITSIVSIYTEADMKITKVEKETHDATTDGLSISFTS